jgi:chemotaxis protein histidine kinase CheA
MGIIREGDSVSSKELVKLVFRPGFSTAETITEVSGRGVGAGAALELVQRIGGKMSMTTREGHGTTFLLSIPDPDREINYCES